MSWCLAHETREVEARGGCLFWFLVSIDANFRGILNDGTLFVIDHFGAITVTL